ncbi:putative iron ABC transporter substrate-binding protein [Clostridium sp. CAG:1013]|nr:putative iron ABC transporter substrate-binding protein [Clostridium sp. CAG:1013]
MKRHDLTKRLVALVLILAMVLSLAACGTTQEQSSSETTASESSLSQQETESETTSSESSQELSSEPQETDSSAAITLTDQAGREVVMEEPAQTIVSCYYITTYATIALGLSDRVIGLEMKADSRPIYQMAAPQLLELPNVGSLKEFNVEAAAALEPDLVLMPVKLSSYADTLTDLGINVLVVDPESQEQMEEMLTLIATACGVEERAQELLDYYDEKLEQVASYTYESVPQVYMGSNSSYLETAPGGMYQSDLIGLAGGENVAQDLEGDYWTEVSYETILSMDPEVIIVPCGAAYTAEDITADPQLAEVTAVKNGQVYQMPQEIEEWDSPVPSGILGVLWLTSVLHDDVYSFDTFQADVVDYYEQFYGFTIDTALITK